MSDLHEARDPEREPQIDTVGWLFLAFAVAITAAAAMVAYRASDTMVANAPVAHVAERFNFGVARLANSLRFSLSPFGLCVLAPIRQPRRCQLRHRPLPAYPDPRLYCERARAKLQL